MKLLEEPILLQLLVEPFQSGRWFTECPWSIKRCVQCKCWRINIMVDLYL